MSRRRAWQLIRQTREEIQLAALNSLCQAVFGEFDPDYLARRWSSLSKPSLILAEVENEPIGFKLGYPISSKLYYSWLGGVVPASRRQGLGAAMSQAQHQWAAELGFQFVETRTRAENAAMIIVNLKQGFRICGFERNTEGADVIIQRKGLASDLA